MKLESKQAFAPGSMVRRLTLAGWLGVAVLGGCGGEPSEQEYLDRGKQAMDRGDYQAAMIDLKNVLRQNGSNAEARWQLARVYIAIGNGEGAEKELQNARRLGVKYEAMLTELGSAYLMMGANDRLLNEVTIKPGMTPEQQQEVAVLRGYAQLGLNQVQEAQRSFQTALTRVPKSAKARIGLARTYVTAVPAGTEQRRQALELVEQALGYEPDNVEGLLARGDLRRSEGNFDGADADFQQVLRLRKGNVLGLLGRAEVAIARNQYDPALQYLQEVRAVRPGMVIANYLTGLALFRKGQEAQAKEFLAAVLKAQPNHPPTLLLAGTINYNEGNLATAISQLSGFVLAAQQHVPARKLLAAAYLRQQQPEKAVQVLLPVIRIAAGDVQLFGLLGRAFMENHDYKASIAAFQQALKIAPDNESLRSQLALSALALGDSGEARRQLDVQLGLGKESLPFGVVQIMDAAMRKDLAGAIARARALVDSFPREAFAQHLLGSMYQLAGRLPEARTAYKAAIDLDPGFVQGYTDLGGIELELGDFEAASKHLKEALSRQPDNVDAMVGLAQIAGQKGGLRQQADYLNSAFIKRPDDRRIGMALAESLRSIGDLAGASAVLRQLESRVPDDPKVLRATAELLVSQQNYVAATNAFRTLSERTPEDVEVWYALGKLLAVQGQNEAARTAYERVLALKPDDVPTLTALAEGRIVQGQFAEAQSLIGRIRARAPDDSVIDKLTGDIALRERRYDDALGRYEAAYRRRPESAMVDPVIEGARVSGKREVAIAVLRDWLKRTPDDHARRLLLAGLLVNQPGERPAAIAEYEQLVGAGAGGVPARNNLALLYNEAGDPRAVALAEELLKASNADLVLDTVGWIFVTQGDARRGLEILQSVARRLPKNGGVQLHLALAYARMDRVPQAASTLESYLASAPADAPERMRAETQLAEWRKR